MRLFFEKEIWQFIKDHENDNPDQLMLKASKFPNWPFRKIVQQIKSRQKAKNKLPGWYKVDRVIFPPQVSMEQCSSEHAAKLKATFLEGEHLIDLTGGAGVDSYYLSKNFNHVTYVESEAQLVNLAEYNFRQLGVKHITCVHAKAEDFLKSFLGCVDWIYIDPSRRLQNNKRAFAFSDCTPNVITLVSDLLQKGKKVCIKASPMMDIEAGANELGGVEKVVVIAINNECKELLFFLGNTQKEYLIEAYNITSNKEPLVFRFSQYKEKEASISYSLPLKYIYEPNRAVLKAGAFKMVSERFDLYKLHPNTHLYTADFLTENFPGNIFQVLASVPFSKRAIKEVLPQRKAVVKVRNCFLSPEEVRKRLAIKEGGINYLLVFQDVEEKIRVLVLNKIQ